MARAHGDGRERGRRCRSAAAAQAVAMTAAVVRLRCPVCEKQTAERREAWAFRCLTCGLLFTLDAYTARKAIAWALDQGQWEGQQREQERDPEPGHDYAAAARGALDRERKLVTVPVNPPGARCATCKKRTKFCSCGEAA